MDKKTKSKGGKPRVRSERRFEPRARARPGLVHALGALGALAMGAGAWEQFGSLFVTELPEAIKIAPYVLTVGSILTGAAIWIGTTGDPALRVGDAGLAVEKGGLSRMPWYAIESIEWRDETVRVAGRDEVGTPLTIAASLVAHPTAAARIVKEARARVPLVVKVPEDATLPAASADAGQTLPLDPPQVVGRHCAASGKVISYEPDARVCPRCELVYHKAHVPETCACGASLADLRAGAAAAGAEPPATGSAS
jgi:hypothetical protein